MAKEIWKDIKGYEGLYQVSSFGNVKSLDRYVDGINGSKRLMTGRILKHQKDGNGYHVVHLSKLGKVKNNKIHWLVAETFLNHKRNGFKYVIHHLDRPLCQQTPVYLLDLFL